MKSALLLATILAITAVSLTLIFRGAKPKTDSTVLTEPQQPLKTAIDIKASFAIFTNGTFRIFIGSMYHNRSTDVYIESGNPNIVVVKKPGITWNDFFKTLPFSLTKECLTTGTGQTFCNNSENSLKFYLNNKLDANALDRVIISGDKLLVSYGDINDPEIENQLQKVPIINY